MFGALLALFYLLLLVRTAPFDEDADDILEATGTLVILLTLLAGFALKAQAGSGETVYEEKLMAVLLIFVNSVILTVGAISFVLELPCFASVSIDRVPGLVARSVRRRLCCCFARRLISAGRRDRHAHAGADAHHDEETAGNAATGTATADIELTELTELPEPSPRVLASGGKGNDAAEDVHKHYHHHHHHHHYHSYIGSRSDTEDAGAGDGNSGVWSSSSGDDGGDGGGRSSSASSEEDAI